MAMHLELFKSLLIGAFAAALARRARPDYMRMQEPEGWPDCKDPEGVRDDVDDPRPWMYGYDPCFDYQSAAEAFEEERVKQVEQVMADLIESHFAHQIEAVRKTFVPLAGNEGYERFTQNVNTVRWAYNTIYTGFATGFNSQVAKDIERAKKASTDGTLRNWSPISLTAKQAMRNNDKVVLDLIGKGFLVFERGIRTTSAIVEYQAARKEASAIRNRADKIDEIMNRHSHLSSYYVDFSTKGREVPPLIQSLRMLSVLLTGRSSNKIFRLITATKTEMGDAAEVAYIKHFFLKRLDQDFLSDASVTQLNEDINDLIYDEFFEEGNWSFADAVGETANQLEKEMKVRLVIEGVKTLIASGFLASTFAYSST